MMKIILQGLLLISLLALPLANAATGSDNPEHIQTKEEYAKWMSKVMEQELRKSGYSKDDFRVEIKVKGALMTTTYSGNLLKDKGFRSQMIESHKGENEKVSDAKAYSLGIRVISTYLEDGTLLTSGTVTE